jgi:hypothetical protein
MPIFPKTIRCPDGIRRRDVKIGWFGSRLSRGRSTMEAKEAKRLWDIFNAGNRGSRLITYRYFGEITDEYAYISPEKVNLGCQHFSAELIKAIAEHMGWR